MISDPAVRWVLVILLGLFGVQCAATTFAGNRRVAETRLGNCLRFARFEMEERACFAEEHQWCKQHELEVTCGEGW